MNRSYIIRIVLFVIYLFPAFLGLCRTCRYGQGLCKRVNRLIWRNKWRFKNVYVLDPGSALIFLNPITFLYILKKGTKIYIYVNIKKGSVFYKNNKKTANAYKTKGLSLILYILFFLFVILNFKIYLGGPVCWANIYLKKVNYFKVDVSDALKLILKETVVPSQANKVLFYLAPVFTLIFSLLGWAIIPFGQGLTLFDFSLGILYTLALSSLGVYGILFAGWSANSKYAFLGSLRSTAAMISYELILSSAILVIILLTGSFNYTSIIESQQAIWFIIPLLPIFILYFISILAETSRTPFDLQEAESELVAGFFTEHSSIIFVFFFLRRVFIYRSI